MFLLHFCGILMTYWTNRKVQVY